MVLIFRTNIEQKWVRDRAFEWLQQQPGVCRFSIDMNDEDSILKIVATTNLSAQVLSGMDSIGVYAGLLAIYDQAPD